MLPVLHIFSLARNNRLVLNAAFVKTIERGIKFRLRRHVQSSSPLNGFEKIHERQIVLSLHALHDPPSMKWSDLGMSFDIKEDQYAEEEKAEPRPRCLHRYQGSGFRPGRRLTGCASELQHSPCRTAVILKGERAVSPKSDQVV